MCDFDKKKYLRDNGLNDEFDTGSKYFKIKTIKALQTAINLLVLPKDFKLLKGLLMSIVIVKNLKTK